MCATHIIFFSLGVASRPTEYQRQLLCDHSSARYWSCQLFRHCMCYMRHAKRRQPLVSDSPRICVTRCDHLTVSRGQGCWMIRKLVLLRCCGDSWGGYDILRTATKIWSSVQKWGSVVQAVHVLHAAWQHGSPAQPWCPQCFW